MTKATQLSFFENIPTSRPSVKTSQSNGQLPKTYKGIYAMHKYWSKKPYNLIADYINRFSSRGDIVVDTFCGSGVTIIESVRMGRRAVGIDINPSAILITQMGLSKVEIKELQKKFNTLKREAKPIIDDLYRTECPKCHYANAIVTHTIWNEEYPQEVWSTCPQCQTRKGVKAGSEEDLKAALSPTEPPHWYPATELLENSRINAKAGMNVSGLFTKRALVALSLLLFSIRQIKNKNIRRVLEFCFNGALGQASKMVFVIRRRGKTETKAQVGSWVIGYWVPAEHFEINVWQCFENRFRRIVKGKQEVNAVISPEVVRCANFDELSQVQEGYWVSLGNATSLAIGAESIDYALIDPPHGNRIPYLELSLMWNAWLGFKSDWENEIVISQAKQRQKDIKDYQNRLTVALTELWRVLKPNKYASIVFNRAMC